LDPSADLQITDLAMNEHAWLTVFGAVDLLGVSVVTIHER
jgi:hypothetical protein